MNKVARFKDWDKNAKNHYPQADGTCFVVDERDQEEIELVGGGKFRASKIGWGSVDTMAFGTSPEQAIERYKAGKFF